MRRWIRKRRQPPDGRRIGDPVGADWHLEGEAYRDMVITACGLNLGRPGEGIEVNEDESTIGRCPACAGAALQG